MGGGPRPGKANWLISVDACILRAYKGHNEVRWRHRPFSDFDDAPQMLTLGHPKTDYVSAHGALRNTCHRCELALCQACQAEILLKRHVRSEPDLGTSVKRVPTDRVHGDDTISFGEHRLCQYGCRADI